MENLKNKETEILKVFENYGYIVGREDFPAEYDENEDLEFYLYNLYDEDYIIPFRRGYILEDFKSAYDSFDLDEYVEMWLEAKRSGVRGVPSVLFLVENGQDIVENLKGIVEDLERI